MKKLPLWRKILIVVEALAVLAVGAYDVRMYGPKVDDWLSPPAAMAYNDLIPEAAATALPVKKTSRDFAEYVRLSKEVLRHADDPATFGRLVDEFAAQGARVQAGIRQLKAADYLLPEERALLANFETEFAAFQSKCRTSFKLAQLGNGSAAALREASALLDGQDEAASSTIEALAKKLGQRAWARRMA